MIGWEPEWTNTSVRTEITSQSDMKQIGLPQDYDTI